MGVRFLKASVTCAALSQGVATRTFPFGGFSTALTQEALDNNQMDYMVVAGGGPSNSTAPGNSGAFLTGGGGAGGVLIGTGNTVSCIMTPTYCLAGGACYCIPLVVGGASTNSCLGTFIATAGGTGAGSYLGAGGPGGSGGGGRPQTSWNPNAPGTGIAGQGTPGSCPSGGGFSSSSGTGYTTSICGAPVTYATGGLMGTNGPAGATNTGNGAAGRAGPASAGTAGGSGIVIIRIPTNLLSAGGNACCTVAGKRSHIFTSSGSWCITGSLSSFPKPE
jgi:hypothetical protein